MHISASYFWWNYLKWGLTWLQNKKSWIQTYSRIIFQSVSPLWIELRLFKMLFLLPTSINSDLSSFKISNNYMLSRTHSLKKVDGTSIYTLNLFQFKICLQCLAQAKKETLTPHPSAQSWEVNTITVKNSQYRLIQGSHH